MTMAIRADNLHVLRSFKECKEWYESGTDNGKGMRIYFGAGGGKNLERFALMRRQGGRAYAIRFHDTDIVTFHDTGTITVDASYDSISTRMAINEYTGVHGVFIRSYDRAYFNHISEGMRRRLAKVYGVHMLDTPTSFEYIIDGVFSFKPETRHAQNVYIPYINRLDKSKGAQAAKRYQNLFDFAKIFAGQPIQLDEDAGLGRLQDCFSKLAEAPNNDELYYPYITKFMWADSFGLNGETFDYKSFKKRTRELIYERHNCYRPMPVPLTVRHVPRDAMRKQDLTT